MKTTIDHNIRKKMGITCDEYVILEATVNHEMSGKKKLNFPAIGFTDDDIILGLANSLIKKGFLKEEIDEEGNSDISASEQAMSYFKPDHDNFINNVIAFLNAHTNSKFSWQKKDSRKAINDRINDGFSYSDFCNVVKFKYNEWKNTDQEQYLRPVTLFGNKFEGYLQGALKSLPKEPENTNMKGMVM